MQELLFLGGFIVFIVAILSVDMLAIDRKAHVVSIKEAGIWTGVWMILALGFSVFLWFHGDMVHGIHDFNDLQAVATRYASHLQLNPNDFEGSLHQYPQVHDHCLYLWLSDRKDVVGRQSVCDDDDLHCIWCHKKQYQHVLNWGIMGAIVLRFVFIFLGAAIISRFDWVLLVFGALLMYSGIKMYLSTATRRTRMSIQPIILW